MRQVQQIGIDKLIPYVKNSRTHSDAQVAQIAASIKEFGFTNPILIADNTIIAGHGRVLAARKLGLTDVPCIELSDLSETQRKAYVIADNKLALNAGWDDQMLALELGELDKLGFDMELTGFDLQEIANILDNQNTKELSEVGYNEVFNIIVECVDEAEQEKIFNKLDSEGYKCRVQSL
jgi:ParB-like chromosome segregation protein Spo0J